MKLRHLHEARQPNLSYKEKHVKDMLDRVSVELSGNDSGAMSRLTTRYTRLDKSAKLLTERRNEVNAQMKEVIQRLFDAEDEVLTRIVDTCSYTIMLTKSENAATKSSTKKIDYASIVNELSQMVPELTEQIKALTAKYTELIPPKDTPAQLKVKIRADEGATADRALLALGFTKDSVIKLIHGLISAITTWTKSYDQRLAALKLKS